MSGIIVIRREGASITASEWLAWVEAQGAEWTILRLRTARNPTTGEEIMVMHPRGKPVTFWTPGGCDVTEGVIFRHTDDGVTTGVRPGGADVWAKALEVASALGARAVREKKKRAKAAR
jgi:hypothetical protein